MTKLEIITKAQLYLDDTSELSTQEFSDLLDKMYSKINGDRPWEGTKSEASTTTSASVPYVALETGFFFLTENFNYTDSSYEANRPVVYRGSDYTPYEVVSWSGRRRYRDREGFAYIDFANSRLYFTKQPTAVEICEYDYHGEQTALGNSDSPWFPETYQHAIYHLMVSDDFIIQQSDKAMSYEKENKRLAKEFMDDMAYWNAQLIQI